MIDPQTNHWDFENIKDLIEKQDHHLILKLYLPSINAKDSKLWSHTRDGNYIFRSGYHAILKSTTTSSDTQVPRLSQYIQTLQKSVDVRYTARN